jgi:disulfide bond formation protein DsbB
MMAIALYMEHAMRLEPCPLCIMQRIFFTLTGVVGLVGAIHNPSAKGVRIYAGVMFVSALAGAGFALRQIYLQGLPKDQIPQCLPSIGYMLETDFPMADVLKVLFSGDGNCAEVKWVDPVIGLGIPQWALVGFCMLAGTSVYQFIRSRK